MSFWSELFGDSKRDSKRKRTRKKKVKKQPKNVKEFVIFDKYTDRVVMRLKASSEAKAAKMIKSDDHRIMTAARWDREQKELNS